MVSLQEISSILETSLFLDGNRAVAYLPNKSRLDLEDGSTSAKLDDFAMNMKHPAKFRDGKIFLPGSFAVEITKPFLQWQLKISPEEKTFTYSDHEPLGNMRTTFLNEVFFPEVEAQSNGRIKINRVWNAKICTGYDALKVVQDGTAAHIAVVVPEYAEKNLPLHQVFKSFPTGPIESEQVKFFRGVYDAVPELSRELDAQKLHAVFIATGYPAAFFSVKPLKDLREISGQTWRSASFWHRDFLTGAGATPVTIPWGQKVFDALDDGTLDGLIVNIDSGYDINAHKVAPNILASKNLWLGHYRDE